MGSRIGPLEFIFSHELYLLPTQVIHNLLDINDFMMFTNPLLSQARTG